MYTGYTGCLGKFVLVLKVDKVLLEWPDFRFFFVNLGFRFGLIQVRLELVSGLRFWTGFRLEA